MPAFPESAESQSEDLFDPLFLARLGRLKLVARRRLQGSNRGDLVSRRIGSSLEFAGHRDYTAGDDPRSLDWNAYGRLDRLYVKRFHDEEDMHVMILVDASASMRRAPVARKFIQARRVAATMACLGLAGMHEISIGWFGERLGAWLGAIRGEASIHRALEFLKSPIDPVGDGTSLETALAQAAKAVRRRTLAIVISDFLDPHGCMRGLNVLRTRRFDCVAVQIFDPLEADPEVDGEVRLIDPEDGGAIDVSASPEAVAAYRFRRDRFFAELQKWCRERGVAHLAIDSNEVPERFVADLLKLGVLSR